MDHFSPSLPSCIHTHTQIEHTKVLVKKARVKRLVDDYITIYKACEPM